nr:TetR/AcrR family transcriptional regulator [uncultured Marinifilum sp.]
MKFGNKNIERIVIESTQDILQEKGVKGWNMDDLAKECGMSKRTLYKIIGNKEDLVYRCYEETFNVNLKSIKKFIEQDSDYCTLLNNLSKQIVDGVNEFVIVGSKSIKTEYPRISKMIDEKIKDQQKLLIGFFENGKEKNLLKNNLDADLINNMIDALMSFNVMNSKDQFEFRTNTKKQLDFLFDAIKK